MSGLPVGNPIRYRPMETMFRETAQDIRNNIPKIVIGNKMPPHNLQPQIIHQTPQNPGPKPLPRQDDIFNNREKRWLTNLQKWGLILAVTAVLCYAAWRIIV